MNWRVVSSSFKYLNSYIDMQNSDHDYFRCRLLGLCMRARMESTGSERNLLYKSYRSSYCSYQTFSGLPLVTFVWIQPLSSPMPNSWIWCSGHGWLWTSAIPAIHWYHCHLCNQVINHYISTRLLCNRSDKLVNTECVLNWWMYICTVLYSARFSKLLSNRSSVEGIWFLSIITYKYTADTCFNLLRCQRVSRGETTREFVSNGYESVILSWRWVLNN